MKSFPMGSPPAEPGLYVITNKLTGQIYLGRSMNLRRRYSEWRGVFSTGLGAKSYLMQGVVLGGAVEDWTFSVLHEAPGTREADLAVLEDRAIRRLYNQRPKDVLNTLLPQGRPPVDGGSSITAPKSEILGGGGARMSYAEAATALGIKLTSLQKRLAKYRSNGVNSVTFDTLKSRSDTYKNSQKSEGNKTDAETFV